MTAPLGSCIPGGVTGVTEAGDGSVKSFPGASSPWSETLISFPEGFPWGRLRYLT